MVRISGRSRGCETCRQKRIKCDETRPECLQCVRRGRKCPGSLTGLIVFESERENPTKFRRVEDDRPDSRDEETTDTQLTPIVSPDRDGALGSGTLDPFSAMVVPLTQRTNAHFQHFMTHTSRACYPFEPEIMNVWCWEVAMEQPAIFYGLCSMAASHRFYLETHNNNTNNLNGNGLMVQSLEFRSRIIETTQVALNEISASSAQSIAVMIAVLICVEASNSNTAEMDVHMAGLKRFLELTNATDLFEISTISFLMGVDVLWAIVRCLPPALPSPPRWVNVALSHPAITIRSSHASEDNFLHPTHRTLFPSLGTRFHNSTWSQLVDRSLRFSIQNFCNLVIHYETDEQRPPREKMIRFGDNNPWMLAQRYLCVLNYEHLGCTDLNEPLRRSILALSMTRYCRFTSFPCMNTIAGMLRDSLIPRVEAFRSLAPDLLFWILYVGALAARRDSSHFSWFCEGLAHASRIIGLDDWQAVEALLEQFFYVPRALDRSVERVWADVMMRRSSKLPYPG